MYKRQASRDEDSYVFKSRGKRTVASNADVATLGGLEDITHATPSGQEDTLANNGDLDDVEVSSDECLGEISDSDVEDTLALVKALEEDELSSDDCEGEISDGEIVDTLAMDGDSEEHGNVVASRDYIPASVVTIDDSDSDDEVDIGVVYEDIPQLSALSVPDSGDDDEIGVVFENIPQLSALSVPKNDPSPFTVTLKHTLGGIRGVAVARPSKRPRSSSKKDSKQRKRPKKCVTCATGLREVWFSYSEGLLCCDGNQ